jgi:hypothetical protein
MPIQSVDTSASAIELKKGGDVTPVAGGKVTKLPRSKRAAKGITALQEQEQKTVVEAAQAGYNAPVFQAAGEAYLQGGQQKMAEVIHSGMTGMIPGMSRVIGRPVFAEEYDAWDNVQTQPAEEFDPWGA